MLLICYDVFEGGQERQTLNLSLLDQTCVVLQRGLILANWLENGIDGAKSLSNLIILTRCRLCDKVAGWALLGHGSLWQQVRAEGSPLLAFSRRQEQIRLVSQLHVTLAANHVLAYRRQGYFGTAGVAGLRGTLVSLL